MTINSRLDVSGTTYPDFYNLKIKMSQSEFNSGSSGSVDFDNFVGVKSSAFDVGDELIVWAEKDAADADNPSTKIGTFTVTDLKFTGKENNEKFTLTFMDFGSDRLKNAIVEPTVYNNTEVSEIVTNLISNYVTGVTVSGVVVTSTTLINIQFKNISAYDAIKELAELSNSFFYVDETKDLVFDAKAKTSSGKTFDNTNVLKSTVKKSRKPLFNRIWVYGGNQFHNRKESFASDGAGSEFTLAQNPHNTRVEVQGVAKRGGVLNMVSTPGSGQEYLTDFNTKLIVFTSGTIAADNVPGSSASGIVINYDVASPIIKFGEDDSSIAQYGPIGKTIIDKAIIDPRAAVDVVQSQLANNSQPKTEGTLTIDGIATVTPGNTCIVDLPFDGINNQIYNILSATYLFDAKTSLKDQVLTVKVSEKIKDITDTLKQLILDVKKLQAADVDSSGVLTRLKTATGSLGFKVKEWSVGTRGIGSDFILGHGINGLLGSRTSDQPYLIGSKALPYAIQASGGD